MAQQFTFPQSGDADDAEHFAAMIGQDNLANFVADGLSLTYNPGGPTVDITTGKAFIQTENDTASSSGDTILKVNHVVQVPAVNGLSLVDNDVNYIYLQGDLSTDDNGTIAAFTTQQGGDSLLIGTIDTGADTVEENNRAPDGVFQSLGLGDDEDLSFGADDDYFVSYQDGQDELVVEDSANSNLLEIGDTDIRSSVDLDLDGELNLDGGFTYDGGNAGEAMALNKQMFISEAQYITWGAGDGLFNSNPDNNRNNIHNTGTGGGSYPYNDDFENWVFHARDSKGDIVFMNYDGGGTGIPFLSIRYDEQSVRSHQPLDVDASATIAGTTTINDTLNVNDGNVNFDNSGSGFTLDFNHDDNATISDVAAVDFSRTQWGGQDMTITTQGNDYGGSFEELEVRGSAGAIASFVGHNGHFRLENDLLDADDDTVYDFSQKHVPQERVEQGAGSGLDADTVDGFEGANLTGVVYTQASAPGGAASGETWYDTDTGTYKVYADLGAGAAWHPVPPSLTLEEAVTFAESGITLTHNKTVVNSGSVELDNTTYDLTNSEYGASELVVEPQDTVMSGQTFNDDGTELHTTGANNDNIYIYTLSTPYEPSTASFSSSVDISTETSTPTDIEWGDGGARLFISDADGFIHEYSAGTNYDATTLSFTDSNGFTPNTIGGFQFNSTGSKVFILDNGGDQVEDHGLSTNYDLSTASLNTAESIGTAGDWEAFTFDDTGDTIYLGNNSEEFYEIDLSGSYDITNLSSQPSGVVLDLTGTVVSVVGFEWNDNGDKLFFIEQAFTDTIHSVNSVPRDGDVVVEWDTAVPADIRAWDMATYAISETGSATVTIDVEDDANSTLASDIDINYDLSQVATASDDVQLRATFSRTDYTDNSTLDYAARRYSK